MKNFFPTSADYKVIDSFTITNPFNEKAVVELVEFKRSLPGFVKRYGTHAVVVNGNFNCYGVKIFEINGDWSKVGNSKQGAVEHFEFLKTVPAEVDKQFEKLENKSGKEYLHKVVRSFNHYLKRLYMYGFSYRRPMKCAIPSNELSLMTNEEIKKWLNND